MLVGLPVPMRARTARRPPYCHRIHSLSSGERSTTSSSAWSTISGASRLWALMRSQERSHSLAAANGVGSIRHRCVRTTDAAANQPCILEDLDVVRNRCERHGKGRRQLADLALTRPELAEHGAAGRVRERMKYGIERYSRLLNHVVEFTPPAQTVNRMVDNGSWTENSTALCRVFPVIRVRTPP
jgi:hypothetical protein